MSQLTNHVLDPYNIPVLLESDKSIIEMSIAKDLSKLALHDVFGYGNCEDADWFKVMKRYSILDMFNCTKAVTLNVQELQCLVGSLFQGLDKNIPCNTNIYS